jgi:hypothetical protein
LPGNQPTDTSGGSPPRTGPRSNANRVSPRRQANRNRDLTQFVAVSPGPVTARSQPGFTAIPPRSPTHAPTSPPGYGPNGEPDSPNYNPTSPAAYTSPPPLDSPNYNPTSPAAYTSPPPLDSPNYNPTSPAAYTSPPPQGSPNLAPISPAAYPPALARVPDSPNLAPISPAAYQPSPPAIIRDSPNLAPISPVGGRANSPHTPRPSSSPINRRRPRTSPQWDENGNVIDSDDEPNDDIPEEEPDPDDPCRDVRRERDNALAEITRLQGNIMDHHWSFLAETRRLDQRHQQTEARLNAVIAERNDLTLREVALRVQNDRLEYSRTMRGQTIRRLRNERDALRGARGQDRPPAPVPRPEDAVLPEQDVHVDPQTPPGQISPTRNPRRVIAVVPSPVSAELLVQFPNPGASVQPAPPRPANQRPIARAAATTRVSRSRVAAGEATPPPDLLSPTTRRNRRQAAARAAAQAVAKPSGVSKKPATKGKGRKK